MTGWIKKQNPTICSLRRLISALQTNRLNGKGRNMKPQAQPKETACSSTHIRPATSSQMVTRDKDGLYTMIKGTIHQEDITAGASLVVQWLRILLARQGRQFQSLSQQTPHATEQLRPCTTATAPQALEPTHHQEDPNIEASEYRKQFLVEQRGGGDSSAGITGDPHTPLTAVGRSPSQQGDHGFAETLGHVALTDLYRALHPNAAQHTFSHIHVVLPQG